MIIAGLEKETFFAGVAIIVAMLRYITYAYSIYQGKARPHVFSWFTWGIIVGIGAFAQKELEGGQSVWVLAVVSIGCFVFATIALFMGKKDITKSDWVAFITALLTIPIWQATKDPLYAIALLILIDTLSMYPTFRKAWKDPESEPVFSWFLSGLRYFFAVLAVPNPEFQSLLYPLFLMSMDWLVPIMIVVRKRMFLMPLNKTK